MAPVRLFEAVAPNGARFQVWAESEQEARQFFPLMADAIAPITDSRPPAMEGPQPRNHGTQFNGHPSPYR